MRTVGCFQVHPLVDVSGAIGTTNREAFPGATVLVTAVGWGLNLLLGTRPHRPEDDTPPT